MSENREIAIQIDGVKKRYKLGTIGGGTLVGDIQSWWARVRHKEDPNKKIGAKTYGKNETFMALDGIDLTIYKGERVGIIGHNGAGKSTLLKLLSRVTGPTEGEIGINGRISSMLEVGTGFNGELTGRENVYINGAILGMTKAEVDAKMDQIIEFSECAQFIDTPVKRYSSGMYVKLAFSVAAHLDSEIMIMDEVLAVGDMKFQQKCLNKMSDVSKTEGRTILYVSHNMNTIRQLCDKCVVLSKGKVIFNGDVEEAIQIYLENNITEDDVRKDLSIMERPGNQTNGVQMNYFEYLGKENNIFKKDEKIKFLIKWQAKKELENVAFKIIIRHNSDTPVGVSKSKFIEKIYEGQEYNSVLEFDPKLLADGQYFVSISIFQQDYYGRDLLADHITRAFNFKIERVEEDKLVWHHKYWGSVQFDELKLS